MFKIRNNTREGIEMDVTATQVAQMLWMYIDDEQVFRSLDLEKFDTESPIFARLFELLDDDATQELWSEAGAQMMEQGVTPFTPSFNRDFKLASNRILQSMFEELYEQALPIYRSMCNDSHEADLVSAHCKGYR